MYYLLLENFNNYLNRMYKSFETINEYVDYQEAQENNYTLYTTQSVNFNKNDNIRASHVFNDDMNPDYLVWFDEKTGDIVSRWFVIHYTHLSGTQFRAELKHDTLADNFANIIESPVFVEKGFVGNDDPAVFNHEEMTFNQIKRAEYPIKQKPIPWIVGYLAKDNSISGEKTFSYDSKADYKLSGDIEDWNLYYLCDGTQKRSIISDSSYNYVKFRMRFEATGYGSPYVKEFKFNKIQRMNSSDPVRANYYIMNQNNLDEIASSTWTSFFNWSTIISDINTINSFVSEADTEELLKYDNKILEFDNGIYRLNISLAGGTYGPVTDDNNTILSTYMTGAITNLLTSFSANLTGTRGNPLSYLMDIRIFSVKLTKLDSVPGSYKWEFNATNKALNNAPYKMFAIPYNVSEIPFSVAGNDYSEKVSPDKNLALAWAMSIIKESGNNLYDIQLLPYIPEIFDQEVDYRVGQPGVYGWLLWTSLGVENVDFIKLIGQRLDNYSGTNNKELDVGDSIIGYSFTYQNNNIIGGTSYSNFEGSVSLNVSGSATVSVSSVNYTTGTITFAVSGTKTPGASATARTTFKITIEKEGPVNFAYFFESSEFTLKRLEASEGKNQIPIQNNITNYKESNETEVYRITSPNMASSFEFSPSKNGGNRRFYNAFCTYKPYNPFICISPEFLGLYGTDFKDNRGLILAGDFSLDIISDSWTNYKLQNKNYQLTFDRQIENMEITQEVQRMNEIFSATAGVLKGGLMGGMAGGTAGGPYGAIAGAVIGTASSTIGAVLDYNNNQKLRKEAIDYTRDQFGYSLQNIQALPRTLNKVSSLIVTNKFFPFLEFYSCSEQELQALRDKIKYNGMSIMRIGKIINFLNENDKTYIKCKLIRNTDIPCSSDELLDIANELDKGVFI